jgi:hypothetical protein
MAIPLFRILAFAGFVGLGVYYRKKPVIHRSMMLLATLSILSAAVSRIVPLSNLYIGTVWERLFGPFLLTLVLGVVLLTIRSVLMRSPDGSFATGLGALIVIYAVTMQIAPTEAWAHIATMLVPRCHCSRGTARHGSLAHSARPTRRLIEGAWRRKGDRTMSQDRDPDSSATSSRRSWSAKARRDHS